MFTKTRFEYAPADQDEVESVDQTHPIIQKNSTRAFTSTWIFRMLLGLFFLLLIAFGTVRIVHSQAEDSIRLLPPEHFFPDFPSVHTKFAETPDFMRFDSIGDRAWNGMIPNGAGYVRVPYPRRYDIEKSVPLGINDAEESEVYQTSVVHQLHCLGTLRSVLVAYKNGEVLSNKYDSIEHMTHCLNNIRQGILCAADRTLTFASPNLREDGFYEGEFNGVGAVHKCQNWEATREFLIGNRAMDWNGTIGET